MKTLNDCPHPFHWSAILPKNRGSESVKSVISAQFIKKVAYLQAGIPAPTRFTGRPSRDPLFLNFLLDSVKKCRKCQNPINPAGKVSRMFSLFRQNRPKRAETSRKFSSDLP